MVEDELFCVTNKWNNMFIYLSIGLIIWLLLFNKMVKGVAQSYSLKDVSIFVKDKGFKPTLRDYLFVLVWSPSLIFLWPIVLILYLWVKK